MKAVLAPKDLTEVLIQEIDFLSHKNNIQNPILNQFERLLLLKDEVPDLAFAQQVCKEIEVLEISSIAEASRQLRSKGYWWANYSFSFHRRSELIQLQLPKYKEKKIDFLDPLPEREFGTWTLIEPHKIIYSTKTQSKLPLNEIHFNESKTPPSRAYLKLWELFTIHKRFPSQGERVLDLGSCPGGWTWVLQQLGCHVISIDKAPLDKKISSLSNVEYVKKDAFKVSPMDIGPVDWLFSDVICYPEDLFELVQTWIKSKMARHMVCTIKFQGQTDFRSLQKFKDLKGSQLVHQYHNKHELTWIFHQN